MAPTRRDVLRAGGAAIAGGGAAVATARPGAASHPDQPGESVTIEYDRTTLERYRPRLVFPGPSRERLIGLFGWLARSPDRDTDVAVYWCKYTHQEGWLGNRDSHWGDHEPVQVEIDSQTGEVRRLRASIYHWLKGEVTDGSIPMFDDTHPHLRVIDPWHQYTVPRPADDGDFVPVDDLTGEFGTWLANGLEESLYPGSSTVPWTMRNRPHFWRDTQTALGIDLPVSIDAGIIRAAAAVGIGQAGSLEDR